MTTPEVRDLQLAFDVGHSSLGWAVLQSTPGQSPTLLGCGAVVFQADDCLASQRRGFRRQRRHIRSTRLRIARIKALLAHLGVLTAAELDKNECAWPWLLAARVLRGGASLTWPELWSVLRWYSHNRGYDGNKQWSRHEADVAAAKEDTEKVEAARGLYAKYGTSTMAETWCALCGLDPLGTQKSVALAGKDRPKGQNAAFPREDIEREVRAILEAHLGRLPHVDDALIAALMKDWDAVPCPAVRLPGRFKGGLLFGQLVPRFENRIIARCPLTFERIFQSVLDESGDRDLAREEAEKLAKVPSAHCPEFYQYRWAMQLANVQVATDDPKAPRRLSANERVQVDAQIRERGAFTKGQFEKAVRSLTGGAADNLKQMLLHPDAEKALVVDPVQRALASDDLAPYFATLPERLQKRLRGQLRRGARVSLGTLRAWLAALQEPAAFDAVLNQQLDAASTKRNKKTAALTRDELLAQSWQVDAGSGRAPHSREIMREVVAFVLSTKLHPAEEGGPLYRSQSVRAAQLQRAIDEQTNNHLVRHRLKLLERLHADLLRTYAGDRKSRIAKVTIEVNRDLREFSWKTAKQIAQDLGLRLSNFKSVSDKIEKQLEGQNIRITPGLIRKARIAEDLGWTCPYTGKPYDIFDLIHRRVDKDHVVPRADRASDSLDSLAITFASVNKLKGKRTAALFIEQEQGKPVPSETQLSIKPLSLYLADVKALESFKGHDDDQRRKFNRKRLLVLRDYVEKEFTPRDLTQTSQLVRLGAQALERHYLGEAVQPVLTSLPGSVTGTVRKSWHILGCLSAANPLALDPTTGEVRTKTEIRDITHLHHALDACTIAFASHFLPRDGGAWELLVKRRLNVAEQVRARELFGNHVQFEADGTLRLIDLPSHFKDQIRARLAERRVVQHVPAEVRGLHAELNAWRVVRVEEGVADLRQRLRQPDGTRSTKAKQEKANKLVGLRPGKLQRLKAALVIADNFGLALDPEPTIIPFHKVWTRLGELRAKNGGRPIRVLRNGMLVRLKNTKQGGKRDGLWRVYTVQASLKVDFVSADQVGRPTKGSTVWREVSIKELGAANIEILPGNFSGWSSSVAEKVPSVVLSTFRRKVPKPSSSTRVSLNRGTQGY